jgi:hypothetical protein
MSCLPFAVVAEFLDEGVGALSHYYRQVSVDHVGYKLRYRFTGYAVEMPPCIL